MPRPGGGFGNPGPLAVKSVTTAVLLSLVFPRCRVSAVHSRGLRGSLGGVFSPGVDVQGGRVPPRGPSVRYERIVMASTGVLRLAGTVVGVLLQLTPVCRLSLPSVAPPNPRPVMPFAYANVLPVLRVRQPGDVMCNGQKTR